MRLLFSFRQKRRDSNKEGAIYNAAIFYSIDIVMTIVTASFLRLWLMLLIAAAIVPIVVLVFVGYANQKKINEKLAAENEN